MREFLSIQIAIQLWDLSHKARALIWITQSQTLLQVIEFYDQKNQSSIAENFKI